LGIVYKEEMKQLLNIPPASPSSINLLNQPLPSTYRQFEPAVEPHSHIQKLFLNEMATSDSKSPAEEPRPRYAEFETWWAKAVKQALTDDHEQALTYCEEQALRNSNFGSLKAGTSTTRHCYDKKSRYEAYRLILRALRDHGHDCVYTALQNHRPDVFQVMLPSKKEKWQMRLRIHLHLKEPVEEDSIKDLDPWRLKEIIHIEWKIYDWWKLVEDALDKHKLPEGEFDSLKMMMSAGSETTFGKYDEPHRREARRIIRDQLSSWRPVMSMSL
jgi:hypothetical protein